MHPIARRRWQFLTRGVSVKVFARAFMPVLAWIVFLALFVPAYRTVVHVHGPAGVVLAVLRSFIEIVTMVIALKYFFEILEQGAADDLSIHPKEPHL